VKVAYPHDGIDYNPHPVGLYSLLWQVGGKSMVKNLDTDKYPIGKFRHHKALDTLGNMPLQLTEVDSGYIESGFEFSSDCASNYFGHQFIPSKILVEYHKNGGGRLVTRSMDPRHNSAKFFNTPNLTIRSAGRTHFDLYSLRISPASGNPYNCPDVKIVKIRNDRRIDSIVIPFGCGMSSRQTLKEIDLNWKGISSVELSSAKAFSVDEVNGSPGIAKFENIDHVRLTYDTWDVASVFQHLPIGPVVHPNVLITNNGGGRWYNYWKHGNQWMNFNAPYIQIEGNEQPVSFYHLHVQHSQNDVKVRLKNARSVRIFGVKVENPRTVLRAYNSNDIHVYGHGGMTNPIPGHNQYYFENCQNYKVVSLAEQLYEYNSPGKNYWNYLVKTDYSEALYKSLKDVRVQDVYTNDDFYRPLWWEFATDRESEQMP
jgi:hypothetical protein